MTNRWIGALALGAALFLVATPVAVPPRASATDPPLVLVAEHGTQPGELRPRYTPVPPEEESWYNAGYMFALTGSVARSTMSPALKAPLFVFTVPLDIVLLPFAAIGGLFG